MASRSGRFTVVPVRGRVAALASGGLDSSVMVAELSRRGAVVYPLYVRAGLRWEREELAILRRFLRAAVPAALPRLAILRMPADGVARGARWSVGGRVPGFRAAVTSNYIPGRNLALLSKGAIFCAHHRIGAIAMASLRTNPFPDASAAFFLSFERTVALGLGLKLRVITPFAGLTKPEVIRRGRKLPLELTLTCASPRGGRHCGACTKCAERVEAFAVAGVADPARYARRPPA